MSDDAAVGLATRGTLVRANMVAASDEEAIRLLANAAVTAGFATDEYVAAVLAREKEYPTGLPTAIPVAIPHIQDGCLRSFLGCATLAEPVHFASMDGDEEPLDVRMIFSLGITEPAMQTKVLRQLSVLFQDADCLNEMVSAASDADLLQQLTSRLGTGLVDLGTRTEPTQPNKE